MSITLLCGTLIDGTGREPTDNTALRVEDGLITAIDTATPFSPGTTQVIDLRRWTVLPGLIDAHDHLCFDWTDPKDLLSREPDTWSTLRGAANCRRILHAGITTLRVMGEKNHLDLQLRHAVSTGLVEGPDLLVSGKSLTTAGGVQSWFPDNEVDGVAEIREHIRRQANAGADLIKMFATGSTATRAVDPLAPCFSHDEIVAAVDESRRLGLPLAAHCHGGPAARDLVEAGAYSIEHGAWLTDDVLEQMAGRGVYLVLTSGYAHVVADHAAATDLQRERCRHMIQAYRRTTMRARELGVAIGIGTDENHAGLAIEMRNLRGAGYSPMQSIQAATAWNARICKVDAQTGSLEVGKRADVIAVDGDPLADVDAITRVRFVMRRGTVYRHEM